MENVLAQLAQWEYVRQLPSELSGMKLKLENKHEGTQYWIFSYNNDSQRRKFTLLYDQATKDYMGLITIGLTQYIDVKYIITDLAILEKNLQEHLRNTLQGLSFFDKTKLSSIFIDKGILDWSYGQQLPDQIAGFILYIKPDQPIEVINGSYIILDYSEFATESNFIIYYNIFRDEFFAEIRVRRTPKTTADFDAKTLPDLEQAMETSLQTTLVSMRKMLAEELK